MITWLNYWPAMLLPSLLLLPPAWMPTTMFRGLGGGVVRQWYLNHFLLPLLPNDAAAALVQWYATASVWQEWGVAAAIVININALLLPPLYLLGAVVIGLSSWVARKDIELKRRAVL
jgi:hypothetical protein